MNTIERPILMVTVYTTTAEAERLQFEALATEHGTVWQHARDLMHLSRLSLPDTRWHKRDMITVDQRWGVHVLRVLLHEAEFFAFREAAHAQDTPMWRVIRERMGLTKYPRGMGLVPDEDFVTKMRLVK